MRKNFAVYFVSILIFYLGFIGNSIAIEEIDKAKSFLKNLTKKKLTKNQTLEFIQLFAITMVDERGDGEVTYIFDEKEYKRYKNKNVLSKGAWRFTKLGTLRLFNGDIKLSWKIKMSEKNNIFIKTKYQPIAKAYVFTYKPKKEFLSNINK